MPRARNDFWMPSDDWPEDDEHPDADADPERDRCSACWRIAVETCQGPRPHPRPCPSGLPMPPASE